MEDAIYELQELLEEHGDLDHLQVRKHGKSLILYSGEEQDKENHARFTMVGRDLWGLSFPHHTGKWERVPFTGSLEELFDTVTSNFPFLLEQH